MSTTDLDSRILGLAGPVARGQARWPAASNLQQIAARWPRSRRASPAARPLPARPSGGRSRPAPWPARAVRRWPRWWPRWWIQVLIDDTARRIARGQQQVQGAGGAMAGVVDQVNRVAGLVVDISTLSAEQARKVDDVHRAVSELDTMTRHNADLVGQSAAAAGALNERAARLADAVGVYGRRPQAAAA